MAEEKQDFISLKWGTLKAWHTQSEEAKKVLREYFDTGPAWSAMARDTPEQREILIRLIEVANLNQVYLDFDGEWISKEEAIAYLRRRESDA